MRPRHPSPPQRPASTAPAGTAFQSQASGDHARASGAAGFVAAHRAAHTDGRRWRRGWWRDRRHGRIGPTNAIVFLAPAPAPGRHVTASCVDCPAALLSTLWGMVGAPIIAKVATDHCELQQEQHPWPCRQRHLQKAQRWHLSVCHRLELYSAMSQCDGGKGRGRTERLESDRRAGNGREEQPRVPVAGFRGPRALELSRARCRRREGLWQQTGQHMCIPTVVVASCSRRALGMPVVGVVHHSRAHAHELLATRSSSWGGDRPPPRARTRGALAAAHPECACTCASNRSRAMGQSAVSARCTSAPT